MEKIVGNNKIIFVIRRNIYVGRFVRFSVFYSLYILSLKIFRTGATDILVFNKGINNWIYYFKTISAFYTNMTNANVHIILNN